MERRDVRARWVARAQLLGCAVLFALMAVIARHLSLASDGRFSPGQLAVIRFAAGAAFTLAWFRTFPGSYRPTNRKLLVARGVSGGLVVLLQFAALARIPAGEAALLYNLFPVLAVAIAFFIFDEKPTIHLGLAVLVVASGVALVLGGGSLHVGIGWGEAAALGSAVFAATSATAIRALRATDNAPTIFFWFSIVGLPVALPFALGSWPTAVVPWLLALGMGACAFFAQLLMTDAYGAVSVPEAAIWLQSIPIVTLLLAVPLLDEPFTRASLLGVLLGVAGVIYGTVLGHRPRAAPRPAEAIAPPE